MQDINPFGKIDIFMRIPVIVPTHSGRSRPLAHEMVLRG
jgi:hypothetical protein